MLFFLFKVSRKSQLMWVGIAGFWGFGVTQGSTQAFPLLSQESLPPSSFLSPHLLLLRQHSHHFLLYFRGMGRQSQLMWVGIAGFWGFGVPLGYTLAFHTSLGLSGLWVGSLTGALIVGKC